MIGRTYGTVVASRQWVFYDIIFTKNQVSTEYGTRDALTISIIP